MGPMDGTAMRAERMAEKAGIADSVKFQVRANGTISVHVTESPTYLWIKGD